MRVLAVLSLFSIYLVGCASSAPFKYQHPRPIPDFTFSEDKNCKFVIENKVGPIYPHKALMKYQEGWTIIGWTLYKGAIKNLYVVDSSPQGVFEESSKDALEKWVFILNTEEKNEISCEKIEFKQLFVFDINSQTES